MPWARSLSLWLSSLGLVAGCGDAAQPSGEQPVGRVADRVIDASVVEMVARRDGLEDAEARQRVADTLRLVAAAEAERDARAGEPQPLVDPARETHLRRAALARLWLVTDFEPKHPPEAIPAEHPLLVRARASGANIHPRIHVVCQVIAVPRSENGKKLSPDELMERAGDTAWRARAREVFGPAVERLHRYVPPDDQDVCGLMGQVLAKLRSDGGDVDLQYQQGGFDLDACLEEAPDGTCAKPTFALEWTREVGKATGPGFVEPFESPFGLHLVYVKKIEEARQLDDPDTDAYLRDKVHDRWRSEAFGAYLDKLRKRKSVKVAASAADAAAPTPAPEGS